MFAKGVNFADLGLSSGLIARLEKCGISSPTNVQAKLIPRVMEGTEDLVVASETGSGKTFAYALPVIQEFLNNPASEVEARALVLVPTQELSAQLIRQVSMLETDAEVATLGGDKFSVPRGSLIVCCTPRTFLDRAYAADFADIRWLIIDEADMLLEGSFRRDVEEILYKFRRPLSVSYKRKMKRSGAKSPTTSHPQPGQAQIIFLGATFPEWVGDKVKSVSRWIRRRYPDAVDVRTDLIHKINPLLEEHWIDVKDDDPMEKLAEVIRHGPDGQVLVFCNTADTALSVYGFLNKKPTFKNDVRITHKSLSWKDRLVEIDCFREGEGRILVSTDVAARGLDLGKNITHVVQYNFGTNVVSYLHRIGRTARAGRNGLATHLVGQEGRALAEEIKGANRGLLESMFSRNRNLSNKRKKQRLRENPQGYEKGAHRRQWDALREKNGGREETEDGVEIDSSPFFDDPSDKKKKGWREVY
ncbi:hypothetical protein NDN08_000472 [Rhodosorus marinus]|uniref:ATP-dependent RNA helicase n=1 Tax=Rhodosorus marinus TaxID=101924 RepID=A0AAV8UTN0_9RHOD|nr:hypothetical protein NDN08_000472 [Rhodosorus marinus]